MIEHVKRLIYEYERMQSEPPDEVLLPHTEYLNFLAEMATEHGAHLMIECEEFQGVKIRSFRPKEAMVGKEDFWIRMRL